MHTSLNIGNPGNDFDSLKINASVLNLSNRSLSSVKEEFSVKKNQEGEKYSTKNNVNNHERTQDHFYLNGNAFHGSSFPQKGQMENILA